MATFDDEPAEGQRASGRSEQTVHEERNDRRPDSPSSEATPRPASPTVKVDDADVTACYANFCRVSSTPEELILDLGLNPQPLSAADVTVRVSQRIVLNHFTAKRLLSALSMAMQRHEQAFGVLETDVRKRVRSQ